jgi:hypothetical protein
MKVISGKVKKPFNVLLYGQPGAGKSTWAACAPNPIFIASDELDELDADRLERVSTFDQVTKQLKELGSADHNYKTVVLDTVDGIETIIQQEILSGEKTDKTRTMNKAVGGYGNAYGAALNKMLEIKDLLTHLRDVRWMNVILICHPVAKVTNDPLLGDSYTEYQLALHEKIQTELVKWVSAVLFLAYDVGKSEKERFAVGSGARYIYTQKKPGFEAKNRYNLDPVIACPVEDPFGTFNSGYETFYSNPKAETAKIIEQIETIKSNIKDGIVLGKIDTLVTKYKLDPDELMRVKVRAEKYIGGN